MHPLLSTPRRALEGEFESEVCLPVRVRYRTDSEGVVEVTHVAFTSTDVGKLLWQRLPEHELHVLEEEAEVEATKSS